MNTHISNCEGSFNLQKMQSRKCCNLHKFFQKYVNYDIGKEFCANKLCYPVLPEIRYINLRTLLVFTANKTGTLEVHHIMHPNIPRRMNRTTQCMDLTSGLPREKITSIEFVDRSPYFLYGTFDGRVGMVKVNFHDGEMSTSFEKRILWRDKDPVISLRVSQLDNAFVALISYNSITKMYFMNVIDIIGEKKETLDPVVVLRVHSSETMLDICWLWDHPCRLILSINGSIRLFDVRNALYTEQSLFFDGGLTLVASNKFRTHQFAGYNGFEVLIFDSRNLFGPVKQFSVSQASQIGLHSLKWNPYIPDELLLHFNGSNDILRCSIKNSDVDPFKNKNEEFSNSDIFTVEDIWNYQISQEYIDQRRMRYVASSEIHVLLRYGEQYDLCKTNQDVDLPLFWSSPKQQHLKEAASHPFSTNETPKDSGMLHSLHARQHAMNKSVSEPAIFPHSFLGSLEEDRLSSSIITNIIHSESRVKPISRSRSLDSLEYLCISKIILPFNHEDSYSNRLTSSSFPLSDPELLPKPFSRCSLDTEVYCNCTESFSKFWMTYEKPLKKLFENIGISPDDEAEMFELEQYLQIILNERNIHLTEGGDSFVISLLSKMGIFPDDNGTSAMYAYLMRVLSKDNLTCKNDSTQSENLNSECHVNSANTQDSTLIMGDDGQKIKLATPTISFDFAPVGYSGIIHLTVDGKTPKFQFSPFITADETVTIFPEHITILDDIKKSEVRDTMPTYLYNIMKERLKLGMNKIDLNNPLLSILENCRQFFRKLWFQWILCSARHQYSYSVEINNASEVIYDEEAESDKQENYTVPVLNTETMLKVKGFPGLLQLCSLDAKEITDWKPFDSDLFSNYSVARSDSRFLMLAPYCLAFDENHTVSFTSFTCSDSIEDQMEWSYLALINGDSKLFIQFVKYLYDMLGKPVSENHAFGILDAVYFLGVVLDMFIKLKNTLDDGSTKLTTMRLDWIEKVETFFRRHSDASYISPCLIPILTLMLGEVTGVPIHVYSLRIMNNEALSLPLRIAWAVNLLPNEHLFEAILTLFRNSAQMDRLQFVGLGRHPDSLSVLSDYLYVSRDCQIIAHLLLASRCLEDDKEVPSLYDLFPTRFVDSCDEIETLLHMARSELSRYTIILSLLKEFTLRKKVLNMVPDLEPENHLTKIDISCTFCSASYENAIIHAEAARDAKEKASDRIRLTTPRTPAPPPLPGPPALVDLHGNFIEQPGDFNGTDGGTEVEIKRPPDSACSQCRKAYPRCALCGISFGTPLNDYDHPAGSIAQMLSICLNCNHGGHMKHIVDWFRIADTCPVYGCSCRCIINNKRKK